MRLDMDEGSIIFSIVSPDSEHTALLALVGILVLVALVCLTQAIAARGENRFFVRLARRRAKRLGELLRTVRMAESIAELGVWQYDPATGEQHWSDGMRSLFGIEKHETFLFGDAETLLFANDIDLIGQVALHGANEGTFALHYDIHGYDGIPRSLSIQACNLRNQHGTVERVVAVVRDVTDQIERERQLERSRATALKEARQARALAETDALTGLANRRRVMDELDEKALAARNNSQSLALVVFDVDHFKEVNDTYGHPAGDKVLKQVADIATRQAREGDLVGRVGGEEFVWIVPGADEQLAGVISERLRQAIALGSAVGAVPPVTCSVGFATLMPDDTALSLFARADAALYQAKHNGRNQVRQAA